ncbi:MAG: flagellar hook-length control protein FliK [Geobacteraceae bacterium]|nr:flagellar hook-length control protein FliK [Geobacteraceae bacterium]
MRINNDYWRSILSATKVSAETGTPDNRSGSLQNLVPGQQVQGEVLARLSDQVYLVKIAGDIYRTELPEPTQTGTKLILTFRTSEPRPEFSLQSDRSDVSPVRLSPTAASLIEALKVPSDQSSAQSIKSLEPLLTSPPVNSLALATSLRNALSFSGLFYESHLLQWFLGERLFADIQKESRLRLASMAKRGKEPLSDATSSEELGLIADKKGFLAFALENDEQPDNVKHSTALSESLTSALLREQVETLLSGIFHWQGSVWHGQDMAWEVEKQESESNQDCEQSWRTSIRLTLPNLGKVSATLVSSDEGITGKITTDSTTTKNTMQQELGCLEEKMTASGLTLRTMTIEQRDER